MREGAPAGKWMLNSSGNAPFAHATRAQQSAASAAAAKQRRACLPDAKLPRLSGPRPQSAGRRLRRRSSCTAPSAIRPARPASALAQPPPPMLAVASGASLTTMKPLSWFVIQTSPEVMPRSFGKLAFEVAQSKFLTNPAGELFAYWEAGSGLAPWAGGFTYATSLTEFGLLMSKNRHPAAKQLQAAILALSASSTLQ